MHRKVVHYEFKIEEEYLEAIYLIKSLTLTAHLQA